MTSSEIVLALVPAVEALERLSIPYCIGGSVASSAQGIARATADIDLVADLQLSHIADLVAALSELYYVDEDMARDDVCRRGAFNIVHLATMLKLDIFALGPREYDRVSFQRRYADALEEGTATRKFMLLAPEDVVLSKLDWYRKGGEISQRQWNDVAGVLKVQRGRLDLAYLHRWAAELGIGALLVQALENAGYPGFSTQD